MASRGGGAKPPLREVRDPVGQAFVAWRRHIAGASGVPLPEAAPWVPGRKSPRWSAERGPGRTGTGPRLGSAGVAPRKRDRTKECACRRSTRPSSGVGPAAVATATGSSPPQRQSTGRRCGDERRDKREKARQGPGTQTCAAGTRSAARHRPRSGLFDIVKTDEGGGYRRPRPAHAPARGRRTRFLGGASISMSAVAVRSNRASRPGPPTSCTPMGSPLSPASSGSDKRRQPGQRPQGAERGIAGGAQPLRRDAGRGRRDDGVVLVEDLGKARGVTRRGVERVEIVDRDRPPALGQQPRASPRSARRARRRAQGCAPSRSP